MENISARTIVLFVTGILVAAVLGLFVTLRNSTNSTTQVLDLEQIGQAMLLAYQSTNYQYGAGAIPASVLINAGKVPSGIINTTNQTLNSRFNTPIAINGIANLSYDVVLTGIPTATCTDIATDAGLSQFLSSVVVGGTTLTVPVAVAAASTACGAAPTNTITLNFVGHP
jgi:hypothetical protein